MEPSIPVDISEDFNINHDALRYIFRNCADIVFRPLKLSDHSDSARIPQNPRIQAKEELKRCPDVLYFGFEGIGIKSCPQ